MDKLNSYRNIIKNILIEYDRLCNSSPDDDVESLLALDDQRDQYLWFQIGWQKNRRIKGITVHIRIKNHKIWIEEDWTEEGIATELLNAGVPQSDIVLAFHPPSDAYGGKLRALTEFATA